ncbi:MAG: hypothetical protein HOI56_00730 [Gammaproteobacteria bacterium]|nr:hypothetical protein [Gammaproteobacteria bacterium]MBT6331129.1 hypothetical protein [Gammaproteobacteria bacterium]|tara:strand:- start:605 stop:772 length:168 start_codon:yes stop_codon:yes gene_type:complete
MSEKKGTWRIAYIKGQLSMHKEMDFWRLGPMKNMSVLLSLSIVFFFGVVFTILFK